MSRKRDATWRRFQGWLRVSKSFELGLGDGKSFLNEIDHACKAFGLDSTKASHRDLLLGIFSDIHFPPSKPSMRRALLGEPPTPRKKRWNADRISRLNKDVAQIKGAARRAGHSPSPTMVAEALQHFCPDWWGKSDTGTETLIRNMRKYVRTK